MKIGNGSLSPAERQLFVDILFEHEAAIAFDESEMGLLDPSIEPPSVDEFSEDFAGYPITSAIDYFSGYYQIPLDSLVAISRRL